MGKNFGSAQMKFRTDRMFRLQILSEANLLNSGMDDIHRHGVALLLSPRARASLMSYEAVSERIKRGFIRNWQRSQSL